MSKQRQIQRLEALERASEGAQGLADEIAIRCVDNGVIVATWAPRRWETIDYRAGLYQIAPEVAG